ncbi:hypothetical protein N1851_002225 [Merluccius polli]|uniref:DDE Tnp4 domain-containing protein n=1 Tax=Merluccius polli TaxID=89951 RepID=A0AA47NAF9_MERPO|nr:hypothetical protein N1851_002225 [Merluccius polli]
MVNYWRVFGCTNRSDREKHLEYYRLPKVITNQGEQCQKLSEERRRLWLAKLNQDLHSKNLDNVRICSAFLVSWDIITLQPSWNRTQQRLREGADGAAAAGADAETDDPETDDPTTSGYIRSNLCSTETKSELTGDLIEAMNSELQNLRTENIQLRSDVAHLSTTYDQSAFVDEDEMVLFFTGIPTYQNLVLFTFLSPHLPVKSLDKFKQLMLTLMRLRLNVSTTFLSYAFNISIATASRIVTDVIDVMFIHMKPLIIWPEMEHLQKTMPMQFRKHFVKKCAVIIDCFEVFIERPSNLIARAETWFSYKHHNTVKFLIGITPQGTVSYISNAWGGRVSDKHLTENCGLFGQHSFLVILSLLTVALIFKPLWVSQLAPVDLETTRKIAHVRIHVERVIGSVRQKYTILGGILPIDFLMCKDSDGYCTIDKIVLVCCALVNLCPSIVDFDSSIFLYALCQ